MAALLQVPRCYGDAAGDCFAGDRDNQQVDAIGGVLGEAGDALLGSSRICLPLHSARVHALCTHRYVCRYPLCL